MTREGHPPARDGCWRVGVLLAQERVRLCAAPSASSRRLGWVACCTAPRIVALHSTRRGLTVRNLSNPLTGIAIEWVVTKLPERVEIPLRDRSAWTEDSFEARSRVASRR
jgi:hypothetical protein